MPSRATLLPLLLAASVAALAGCKQDDQAAPPAPLATETDAAAAEPSEAPSGMASGSADGIAAELDLSALEERRDPERLLRFYVNAIRVGDWAAAARAWTLDAQMTPEKLQAEYGGAAGPKIALGKGDWENAGGSLYYVAPITVTFPDPRPSRRGSIVLVRANDVPGASPLQLVWRIERGAITAQ